MYMVKKSTVTKIVNISKTKNIQKIYHLSDIHIRLDSGRYDEYREVFEKVYTEIRKDSKNSVIVITGDILHSKTNLKPECIDLVKDFFHNLSNITDVFAIIGNHDCNTNNKDSMDSLSPLLKKNFETNNKVKLLTDSKLYRFGNVLFGVTTIHDKKVTRCLVKSNPNLKDLHKIALYHGFVAGAYTDLGFSVKKEKGIFDIEDFNDYDYVMLGDVHKFQYLNKDKTAAYASSLVQQNYSENIENHGMIKWDLENKSSEFIRIPNNYGFVTLKMDKKGLIDYDKKKVPKIPRIRLIYSKDVTLEDVNEVEKKLKQNHKPDELIINRDIEDQSVSINLNLDDHKNDKNNVDLKSNKVVSDLIMKYVKNNFNYSKLIRENIKDTINECLKEIDYNYDSTTKKISIDQIKFSNTFAYGENNVINFKNLNKIVGLVAPNHYGKSCLIDTILQGIFGNFPRGQPTEVVNINSSSYEIESYVKVNDDQYHIMRNATKTKKRKTVSESLKIYKGNEMLTEDTKTESEALIKNKVCAMEDLTRMNIILQNDEEFIQMNDNKRKDLLYKYFNLDIFKVLFDHVNKKFNQFKYVVSSENSNLKEFDEKDYNKILTDLEQKKEKYKKDKQEKYDKRDKLNHELYKLRSDMDGYEITNDPDEIRGKIKEDNDLINKNNKSKRKKEDTLAKVEKNRKLKEKKIKKLKKELKDYDNIEGEQKEYNNNKQNKITSLREEIESLLENKEPVEKLNIDVDELELELDEESNNLKKYQKLIKINNKKIKSVTNLEKFKKDKQEYDNLDDTLEDNNKTVIKLNKELKKLNNDFKQIEEHKFNPDCEACMSNPITNQKIFLKEKIEKLEKEVQKLEKDIKSNQKKKDKLEKNAMQYNELLEQQNINKEAEHKVELNQRKEEICQEKINQLKQKIEKTKKIEKIRESNNKIDIQIKGKRKEIIKLEEDEFDKYNEYQELKEELDNVTKEKEEKEGKEEKLSNEIMEINSENETTKSSIEDAERELFDMKEYENKKNEVEKLEKEFNLLNNQLNQLKDKESEVEKEITETMMTKQKVVLIEERKNKALNLKEQYSYLLDVLGKNGMGNTLFRDEILPKLEDNINNILNSISDFNIEIEYVKGSIKIYKIIANKRINLSMMSGYEKFIANVAFRLALADLNNSIKTDFFIIDEGFSYCDTNHLEKLKSLFEYLRRRFKWSLVISHLDEIKENFDTSINIDMKNGRSYLREQK